MRIGGMGNVFPTYIYNPNNVSSKSMNKLSRISDDVLDKKVDYSETVAEENQNPLKKGQTIDFKGILAKQMQQGQNRAARIMPNGIAPVEKKTDTEAAQVTDQKAAEAARPEVAATVNIAENTANDVSENSTGFTQMQRAIQAYEMFMTA